MKESSSVVQDAIRILLIDDHLRVHYAISEAIDHWDDMMVVGSGSNGQEAIQLCEDLQPDIILMDVLMPVMDGIEATRIISERFPHVKILALSSFQDDDSIHAMLEAGAVGYLLKNSSIDDLAHTIRTVNTGTSVFSPEVAQTLLHPNKNAPRQDYNLTPREFEVLQLMVNGLNNREIA